jgi:hypothetical protein
MGAVVVGGRAIAGKSLPLIVAEIIAAMGIVVIADLLIARHDL